MLCGRSHVFRKKGKLEEVQRQTRELIRGWKEGRPLSGGHVWARGETHKTRHVKCLQTFRGVIGGERINFGHH